MFASAPLLLLLVVMPGSYKTERESAERVPNLGRFLESYLGDCMSDDPSFDKKGCLAEAARVQKEKNGKVHVFEVPDATTMFQLKSFDSAKGVYRVAVTPFFSERALAMSVGKPTKLTADGLPIVKNVPLSVKMPAGETEFSFKRRLERGHVTVEIMFKPRAPWTMKPKGQPPLRGLSVDLVGIRLTQSPGETVIAEETY